MDLASVEKAPAPRPEADRGGRARKLVGALLCTLGALAAALLLEWSGALSAIENASYDFRVRTCPARFKPDPPIALVLVDQKSLDFFLTESGRGWPWRRDVYAAMIDALKEHGARAVAFDMLFTEPSESWPEDDEALAAAATGSVPVYHAMNEVLEDTAELRLAERDEATAARWAVDVDDRSHIPWPAVNQLTPPVPTIEASATGVGSVHFVADSDGHARAMELLAVHGERFIPTISLAIARDLLGAKALEIDDRRLLHVGPRVVPLDARGRMLIRFLGPEGTVPSYSAASLVQDHVRVLGGEKPLSDWAGLRGAVVFVGTNLSMDLWKTPHRHAMPGVELQANALAGLLSGQSVSPPARGATLFLSALLAFLASVVVVAVGRPVIGSSVVLLLGLGYCAIAWTVFAQRGIWLPVACPVAALAAGLVFGSLESHAREGQQRRFIRKAFEHYLAPQVIAEIVRDPRHLRLGGVRRELTVFFTDLEGFTTLSERLEPEDLVLILNRYLTEMTRVVIERKGTVDKYVGDAVMAFWGAPLAAPDHARRACLAALDGVRRLHEIGPELERLGAGRLNVRIGLNTGPAVVGNMGSTHTFNYTAMGDTVNLGSRLEAANKEYGTTIMAADSTRVAAGPDLLWRELDLLRVKGKEKAIRVHELVASVDTASDTDRTLVSLQDEALGLYRKRDFGAAALVWRRALELRPGDGPARTMLLRCAQMGETPPPPDWEGEHVMHAK